MTVIPGESRHHSLRPDDVASVIIQGISDPVVVYDREFRFQFLNDAALKVFQRVGHGDGVIGKHLFEEFPDLVGTNFEREMRAAMREEVPTAFVEVRESTGRWSEVRCTPLPAGGLAVIWRDVTAQRRAERTLRYLARASEVLTESLDYQHTVNALAELIVPELADWCSISVLEGNAIRMVAVVHPDPAKVAQVRAFDARFPSDPQGNSRTATVIRTGRSELIPEITDAMIEAAFADPAYRAMVRELGFHSVITVPLKVGDRILGAMSLVAMRETGRRFNGGDIALAEELARRAGIAVEHARLYREAVDARQSAELANDAKVAFLARMSHELRTPLNAIGGYAELIEMGLRGPVSEDQIADLARIRRSQKHLLSLINDILNYAKVEAGRLQYDLAPVRVIEVMETVEQIFAAQIAQRGLKCVVQPPPAELTALADQDKVQQILINLVSNAMKFTPAGGKVTMSAIRASDAVEITVTDTGVGIPGDKLEPIFEPFVQLNRPGDLNQGTGLGLAISRDLARGMGGELSATSTGMGSTFTLRLRPV